MQNKTIIFVHLPKTGGSTFKNVLIRQYDADEIFFIKGAEVPQSIRAFEDLPKANRIKFKFIMGHISVGFHNYLPQPCEYITLLRDPVERAISDYYYVLSNPLHHCYSAVVSKNMSLEDYVRSGISKETDNLQTRLLSGDDELIQIVNSDGENDAKPCSREMLEKAKKNLKDL